MKLAAKVRGLSEPAFRAWFGTEAQCLAVLFEVRWGRSFACERCCCEKYSRINAVPRRLGKLGLPQAELDRPIGIDIGILGVARGLADRREATLIFQRYLRLLIDCNRQPHSPTSMAEVADGTAAPGNRDLDAAAREAWIGDVMGSYHEAIEAALDRRRARGRTTASRSTRSCIWATTTAASTTSRSNWANISWPTRRHRSPGPLAWPKC